jgi:hypothetical protein
MTEEKGLEDVAGKNYPGRRVDYFMVDDKILDKAIDLGKKYTNQEFDDGEEEHYLGMVLSEAIPHLENSKEISMFLHEAIYFLLTGVKADFDGPYDGLYEVLFGEEVICSTMDEPDHYGYYKVFVFFYSVSIIPHSSLPDNIKALENVDIKVLENNLNLEILKANHIYPFDWSAYKKEEVLTELIKNYNSLLDFYREAKDKNANVLVAIWGYLGDDPYNG